MVEWKIVPVEPTEAQMDACDFIYGSWDDHTDVYTTSIEAAPRASEDESLIDRVALIVKQVDPCTLYDRDVARAVLKMLEE